MVSAVNNTNLVNQTMTATKEADIKKLVKYVGNESLQDVPDTFVSNAKSGLSSALLFEGIPLLNFLRRNKKLTGSFKNANMIELGQHNKASLKNLFKGEGNFFKRVMNYISDSNNARNVFVDEKSAVKAQSKAQKLAEKASKATGEKAQKLAEKAAAAAEKATEATTKASGSLNGIKNGVSKVAEKSGKFSNAINKLTKGKLSKLTKFMKSSGAGIMVVFSGISECFSEVVPTFKELGKEKGMKQVGKSAVKVVGDTFGFIAGEKLGVSVGTAIGTAICPGIGTAIGAVCGFVGGMLGSFAMGKITKAITGKSEREKAKEEEQNKATNQISADNNTLEELKNAAMTKIQENAQITGRLSKDDAIALESLQNLGMTNPFII